MTKVGILSIHSFIPENKIRTADQASRFALDESFISDKIGFKTLPRRAAGEDNSRLAELAARKALSAHPDVANELELATSYMIGDRWRDVHAACS
jgi:3-oxoacyl-[acyl-carrier-protein] synthase III